MIINLLNCLGITQRSIRIYYSVFSLDSSNIVPIVWIVNTGDTKDITERCFKMLKIIFSWAATVLIVPIKYQNTLVKNIL